MTAPSPTELGWEEAVYEPPEGAERNRHRVRAWPFVPDLEHDLAVFENVFWDARDTDSLRKMIRESGVVKDQEILEIGTGSGLISLCCLHAGARRVVATDINPSAVANATFNASRLNLDSRLEIRLVPLATPGAFSSIRDDEQFDIIISNPPWEDGTPEEALDYAFFDKRFALMDSILVGLQKHLRPGGRAYLAYGSVTAIRRLFARSEQMGLDCQKLDERDLNELPEVFVPGMLLEVTVSQP